MGWLSRVDQRVRFTGFSRAYLWGNFWRSFSAILAPTERRAETYTLRIKATGGATHTNNRLQDTQAHTYTHTHVRITITIIIIITTINIRLADRL